MGWRSQSSLLEVMLWQLTTQSGPKVLQSSLTWLSAHSSGTCIRSKCPVISAIPAAIPCAATAVQTMEET